MTLPFYSELKMEMPKREEQEKQKATISEGGCLASDIQPFFALHPSWTTCLILQLLQLLILD